MEKFLKKYSTVPNGFIEDFFDISKEIYNDDELSINFDKIVKWLDVTKGNLKRLLINSGFTENYDYISRNVIVKNNANNRSHTVEEIYVTPDCFKELCMLSQTPKAKEVRRYFLSVEKLIRRYHFYIQEKLYDKIHQLEINQRPRHRIRRGVIYFFKARNYIKLNEFAEDLYKLGKTVDIDKRFATYNSENADDIEPLFVIEVSDIDRVEKCIKILLQDLQYRKYKEIYQVNIDILKMVTDNCDKLISGFIRYMKNNPPTTVEANLRKLRKSENLFMVFDNEDDNEVDNEDDNEIHNEVDTEDVIEI